MPSPSSTDGLTITANNGEQYFVFGKNRIKITEHFAADGKPIGELVEELIRHKVKENVLKIA